MAGATNSVSAGWRAMMLRAQYHSNCAASEFSDRKRSATDKIKKFSQSVCNTAELPFAT
jgi:hypothetical protein